MVSARGLGAALTLALGAGSVFGQDWRGAAFDAAEGARRGVLGLTVQAGFAAEIQHADDIQVDGFPLADGSRVSLRMERFEPLAATAEIVVETPFGPTTIERPSTTFWLGTVDGDQSTRAYLAVSGERIDGMILAGERTWMISNGTPTEILPLVLYDLRTISPDLVNMTGGLCQALEVPGSQPIPDDQQTEGFTPRGDVCRIANIAIETDYETTMGLGGDPVRGADYLSRLMGAVSTIYDRDLSVRLQIPYMHLWTTPDDPWTATEMGPQLDQFRNYWTANMRGVRRQLAHFLTYRGLGGGLAYVSVLCNYDWGFGISSGVGGGFPYPLRDHNGRNWPVMVTAHELGHNFGTGHTHDSYDPVIDGCGNGDCSQAWGGTIMSYCHTCAGGMNNIVLNFGPRVVDRINSYITSLGNSCRLTGSIIFGPQPRNVTVRRGQPAVVTTAASGPGVFSYRWYHNGLVQAGGEDGSLEIAAAQLSDAGTYYARAMNACTYRDSSTATLTVLCAADFNRDGFVDFFDYDDYVACFEGNCPPGETADVNGDGFQDFFDYDAYVTAFTGPC